MSPTSIDLNRSMATRS